MFLNIIHRATYAQRLTEHGVGITGRPWMFHRQVGVGDPSSDDRGWSTGRVGASFWVPIAAWKLKQTSPAEHRDSEHEIEIKSYQVNQSHGIYMEFLRSNLSFHSFHSFLESDASTAWDRILMYRPRLETLATAES
jgi:hypothetical protein